MATTDSTKNTNGPQQGTWVRRVALLYALLIAVWIFIDSGLPLSYLFGAELPAGTWLQTLAGWFFVASTAWLLHLLITKNVEIEKKARSDLRLRDRAIESSVNAILITENRSEGQTIVYVNPAFETITGYSSAEVMGRNPRFLCGDDLDQPGLKEIREALAGGRAARAELRNYRRDGSMYWNELYIAPVADETGLVTHYIGIQNDVTAAKQYREALEYQANYDQLTQLPNRNLLQDRLHQAIVHGDRYRQTVAVAHFNLDNFSLINDTLGRAAGDRVLEEVAHRIIMCVRSLDTVACLGGDEFALVSFDHDSVDSVSAELQRVIDTLAQPYVVDGREIYVTCSAGIVLYPQDGDTVEELLRNANVAMRRAKEQGKSTVQYYTPELNTRAGERFDLYNRLRNALERDEFLLHYQPQVDLKSGRVVGVEALIRWQNSEYGMVSPGRFIPLAEETGLIIPIGEWTLKAACAQNKQWQDAGLAPIRISVNLSARQFRERDLGETVARVLKETGLDARYLELELTESVIMHNPAEAIVTLQALRDTGVHLSIDDFGTGYSSLNYLKRFPVHRLKIDQSFVRDVTSDEDDAAIARAVITLGHALELKVIAEGVETKEQLEFLRASGCDEKQGYYFCKPLPAGDIGKLLGEGRKLEV
ncbi:MAG: EAL domain-containing protein [Betaproteobacteria bacterium]|nr:EAL domain-containing protein [Betaproteobacteria bacterium]